MRTKMALHLVKGDVVHLDNSKKDKGKVESVVTSRDGRVINVVFKCEDGKRHRPYDWREELTMYVPPRKAWRYGLLVWLGRKLRAPVKRAA